MSKTLEQILAEAKATITHCSTNLKGILNDLERNGYVFSLHFYNGIFHCGSLPLHDFSIQGFAVFVCEYSDASGKIYSIESKANNIKGTFIY